MTRSYAVVIRWVGRRFSADCPDVPGCIATGRTLDEVLRRMRSALVFHIEGLRSAGERVPRPRTSLATLARREGGDQVYTVLRVAA